MQGGLRARGVDGARVLQVIETIAMRGSGTDGDPVRGVKQYWDFEGKLLAEYDPYIMEADPPGGN